MKYLIKFLTATAVVFVTMALLNSTASASSHACASRDAMANTLINVYGEYQNAVGMIKDKNVMAEFWVSPETGTWTILRTFPNGLSCVVLVGTDYVSFEAPVVGAPS